MKLYRLVAVILLGGLILGAVGYCLCSSIVPIQTPAYIGNVRTGIFHRKTCSYLPHEKNRSYFESREEAIDAGYRPCRKCRP